MTVGTRLMMATYGVMILGMMTWAGRGAASAPATFWPKAGPLGISVSCTFDDAPVHVGDWVEGREDGLCHAVPAQTQGSLGQVVIFGPGRQGVFATRRAVAVGEVER